MQKRGDYRDTRLKNQNKEYCFMRATIATHFIPIALPW